MATQGQQENTKQKIIGLLEIRRHRGLKGYPSIAEWSVTALEILLETEMARIEKRELGAS